MPGIVHVSQVDEAVRLRRITEYTGQVIHQTVRYILIAKFIAAAENMEKVFLNCEKKLPKLFLTLESG